MLIAETRFIICTPQKAIAVDRAYSEELDRVKLKAQHFLADGYYDSVKLIEYFDKERIKCVIAISETIRQGVRNEDERICVELDGACAL